MADLDDVPAEYEGDADSDGYLIALCYQERGLRLNIRTVRDWSVDDWEDALLWIDGSIEAKPAVIVAAEAEYAAARKCRVCGCCDYYACDGGCGWIEADLCTACEA